MNRENRRTLKAVYKALKCATDREIEGIFALLMKEVTRDEERFPEHGAYHKEG